MEAIAPAARDAYAASDGLPARGARVLVSGFSKDGYDEARRMLELHGFVATTFANGADAVLVPSAGAAELTKDAAQNGRRVLVLDDLRAAMSPTQRRSAVEVTEDTVRILDVELSRHAVGGPQVPPAERFAHLCYDGLFLRAARTVAIAARAHMPCALEGDTAVAKTTSVLWVAHLCRQGAVRLNLNGQSDTGELVGRFVPSSEWADWDIELFHREKHLLEPESQALVERAVAERRPLNWVEQTALAANERIPVLAWKFWEGVIPNAMRHGLWVVLDEVNLAEPQVLERLNPVLETPPSLVLAENKGERYGVGGDIPLAESFRIFATMNPSEYAGRSVLSPAFRDRWAFWNFLEPPGKAELRAMLTRLVHGAHPEFSFERTLWRAPDSSPVHSCLDKQPGIDGLLDSIAEFHTAVAATSGNGGGAELGRTRREHYVFTRRTMLAMMQLFADLVRRGMEAGHAACQALEQIYVDRVQPGPDRQAVRTALRAVGLER